MKKLLIAITFLSLVGCSKAYVAKNEAWFTGKRATITVHSGGQIIKTYHSQGKVFSEDGSDGFYFTSEETGTLVEIAPGIVIEYSKR